MKNFFVVGNLTAEQPRSRGLLRVGSTSGTLGLLSATSLDLLMLANTFLVMAD
jgi:hypothetical protein